jgi:UDP-glucose 4-epimerase
LSKKVVVTGGAGFIGSHMVDLLLSEGFTVVAIDNLATGRKENLAHHNQNSRLTFLQADINDVEKTFSAYENADWVIHLAALADIVPSIEKPLDYHSSNVTGTINVLECARKANVKKVLYSASSSCYGLATQYPTPEEATIQPQYPYALTKFMGEQYCLNWSKYYKIPAVSLRFFNVYGPRSRTSGAYGAVFGVFLAQKLNNLPFTVVGDGTQSRDFTFVTDVVKAIYAAAKSNLSGEILNVGTGKAQSINYLVSLLEGPVTHVPKRPGEPEQTLADISKIKELLHWSPEISFEKGVKVMLDNINRWSDAPVWTTESIHEATKTWFQFLR